VRCLRLGAAASAVVALSGCGGGDGGPGAPHRVDELAGSYRGVGFGDPASDAVEVLGPPAERDGSKTPAAPIGSDFSTGVPLIQRNPPAYVRKPRLLRYEGASFLYFPSVGIFSVVVDDAAAVTRRGVHVGDPLDRARDAYPGVSCVRARTSGEAQHPEWCTGQVAPHRYVWFGGDPISVIALGETRMG